MKLKYPTSSLLIFISVFYYYAYTITPQYVPRILIVLMVVAAALSTSIIIKHLLLKGLTRATLRYLTFLVIIFATALLNHWPNIMLAALLSTTLLQVQRDYFVKVFFYCSILLYSAVFCLALIGTLPMIYIGFDGYESERFGMLKYTLGFDGPNQASFSFFSILVSGMYSFGHSKKFTVIAFLLALIVGLLTGSRSGILISLMFVVVYYLYARKKVIRRPSFILRNLFVILLIISSLFAYAYANNPTVNDILSGRPLLTKQYLDSKYVPTLFGSEEVYNKAEYRTPPVDNYFVYVLARYGILGFAIFAYAYYLNIRKELSRRMQIIFIFTMIYGLSEAFFDISGKSFILPVYMYGMFSKLGENYAKKTIS